MAHVVDVVAQGMGRVQRRFRGSTTTRIRPGVVQRDLEEDASFTIKDNAAKGPGAAGTDEQRAEINANLNAVRSPALGSQARTGGYNNAEAGKKDGHTVTVSAPAQTLPTSITAGGVTYALANHVVANMMLPRDDAHRVKASALADALAAKQAVGDPRWKGFNFQGKDLFVTLGENNVVVTAFHKAWSGAEATAYDEFANPEKKAKRLAEEEAAAQQKKAVAKTAATVQNKRAYLEKLIDKSGLVSKVGGKGKITEVLKGKLSGSLTGPVNDGSGGSLGRDGELTGDYGDDLEIVKSGLGTLVPKASAPASAKSAKNKKK